MNVERSGAFWSVFEIALFNFFCVLFKANTNEHKRNKTNMKRKQTNKTNEQCFWLFGSGWGKHHPLLSFYFLATPPIFLAVFLTDVTRLKTKAHPHIGFA